MEQCSALKKGRIKCKNFVTDEGSYYCVDHLSLQELLEQKWDRRDEQLRKARKKYREADESRYKEQLQKAKKKFRESGKATKYEKSVAGKLRKQRYRQKQRRKKKHELEHTTKSYLVGEFVRISGMKDSIIHQESSRLNGFKGIIMELDYSKDEYCIDIGEEYEVNVKHCYVHKCDVPQKYKTRMWTKGALF
eukprot:261048_1